MGTVPCQKEVDIKPLVLEFGREVHRDRKGSVAVASPVADEPMLRIVCLSNEVHRVEKVDITPDLVTQDLPGSSGSEVRKIDAGTCCVSKLIILSGCV